MNSAKPVELQASLKAALDHLTAALEILDRANACPVLGAHVDMAAEAVRARLYGADPIAATLFPQTLPKP